MSPVDLSMEDLPVPLKVDILSRLPVKTIIHCECVCKKWLDIVSNSYFANIHLSRSPASIMVHHDSEIDRIGYIKPGMLTWVELTNELDDNNLHIDLNLTPIFQNSNVRPMRTVNGLVCLWQFGPESDNICMCNPITREYMILPRHQCYRPWHSTSVFSFGVGSLTREYKVMRIFQSRSSLMEAEVYNLGTSQWRSLGHAPYQLKGYNGPLLNSHAHWIVTDQDTPEKLCAFDFDNETFELFPSPPSEAIDERLMYTSLGVLKGRLCQCDSNLSILTVWVMKEYGIKKSWHKELVIMKGTCPLLGLLVSEPMCLIEGLEDGNFLMATYLGTLIIYCPLRKTIVDMEKLDRRFDGFIYRPSFHRLHNFENERVNVF